MTAPNLELLGTAVTLVSSGSSLTSGSVSAASTGYDKMLASSGGGYGYPHGRFVLAGAFGTAPTEGTLIVLKARPLDLSGTNDAEVPESGRGVTIGSFEVNNVTSTQYMELLAFCLPRNAEYYLHNLNTGQTLSSAWALTVTPLAFGT